MVISIEMLRAFAVLKPLPDAALTSLAQHSSLKKFSRRAIVLNAGVKEDHLCFLFEGRLQGIDFTIDGREVGLYFVEPLDFCGELGLFDNGPQPEYVMALMSSTALMIPIEQMRKAMMNSPTIIGSMSRRLAARVRELTFQRSLLSLPNVAQRVCCQLWALVPKADRVAGTTIAELRSPPTHMEIAIMLNLSRETVTRVFQALQSRNLVQRDGSGRILIRDLSMLRALAEGKEEL